MSKTEMKILYKITFINSLLFAQVFLLSCTDSSRNEFQQADKLTDTVVAEMPKAAEESLPLPDEVLKDGWERINVENVGSIDIPPILEVQAGKYKEYVDQRKAIRGYDTPRLVIQQKGLNNMNDESFEKFARVTIETETGNSGEFDRLNFDISEFTEDDINELNSQMRSQTEQSFEGTSLKLVEWYNLKLEKVNGMSCIHVSYKRQVVNKPSVLVNIYIFPNYDRVHRLTLSYRLNEQDYWQPHIPAILKSFRVTNVQ